MHRWHSVVRRWALLSSLYACLGFFLPALPAFSAPVALPAFRIDIAQTSVSGLSSGAFMAVQFGVAYSSIVKGVGAVAGGPYYCAQGRVDIATNKCSCTGLFAFVSCDVAPGATQISQLIAITDRRAQDGRIDATSHLARQRLWLFTGALDSVVPSPVMRDLRDYYLHYVPAANIRFRDDIRAEHAMPTDGFGQGCAKLGSPYINDCKFDAAGELLAWIYGSLQAQQPTRGRLAEFDQSEFIADQRPTEHGLAVSGFIYVPAACETSAGGGTASDQCRLHIAFHGCKQNAASVGDQFIRHAGYNGWAEANRLIVLYPQTVATSGNPNACWDWFNANGDDPDYANKNGRQLQALKGMVDRIAGLSAPPPPVALPRCFTASNAEHVRAGRALAWFFMALAKGSNQWIGIDNAFSTTTLKQTATDFYQLGTCS